MRFIQGDVFTADIPLHEFALVYADPPYANCRFKYARRSSSRQWGRNARADFLRELIARMDAMRAETGVCALSMATPELRLLHLFPTTARTMAWVKPYAPMRPGVWPCFAWEPLVVWGKLPNRSEQKESQTPHDWLHAAPRVPRKTNHETPKPEAFASWVINMTLGPRRGPTLELFAGTCPIARMAELLGCSSTAVDLTDYREPNLFEIAATA